MALCKQNFIKICPLVLNLLRRIQGHVGMITPYERDKQNQLTIVCHVFKYLYRRGGSLLDWVWQISVLSKRGWILWDVVCENMWMYTD